LKTRCRSGRGRSRPSRHAGACREDYHAPKCRAARCSTTASEFPPSPPAPNPSLTFITRWWPSRLTSVDRLPGSGGRGEFRSPCNRRSELRAGRVGIDTDLPPNIRMASNHARFRVPEFDGDHRRAGLRDLKTRHISMSFACGQEMTRMCSAPDGYSIHNPGDLTEPWVLS